MRTLLMWLSVLAGVACAAPGGVPLAEPAPVLEALSLPGDFEPVDRVLIGWEAGNWDYLPYFVDLGVGISAEATVVVVGDGEDAEQFARVLVDMGAGRDRVEHLDVPVDTMWIRDYGPVFARAPDGGSVVVDLPYEGERVRDDALPSAFAAHQRWRSVALTLPIEGGHLQGDGDGRCVLTDEVLFRADEDYHMGRAALDARLRDVLGCERTVYVPALDGEETGHLDVFALVTGPRRVMVGRYEPSDDPINAEVLDEVARILRAAGFEVTRVPMPDNEEQTVFRTYTNALILDGAVLVPVFWRAGAHEQEALATFEAAFPGRMIVPIQAEEIIELAGAVHCTTRAVPRQTASRFARSPFGA